MGAKERAKRQAATAGAQAVTAAAQAAAQDGGEQAARAAALEPITVPILGITIGSRHTLIEVGTLPDLHTIAAEQGAILLRQDQADGGAVFYVVDSITVFKFTRTPGAPAGDNAAD